MESQISLIVSGEYACFTRPEFKVERVSYDVITPSAARGILDSIHWKPAIKWIIDRVHVINPIRFTNIRRNEVSSKIPVGNIRRAMSSGEIGNLRMISDDNRVQRSAMVLRDVSYVIEAHLIMTDRAGGDDNPTKHLEIFRRRARKGQCHHRPCLGTREFAADFELLEDGEVPQTALPEAQRSQDLGWMLLDFDYRKQPAAPKYFRAIMDNGIINVPPMWSVEARS